MFAFNAQGDTFTLTKLFAVSTLVNAVLDPIMIFGWFGFPALGIAGAAIATLISQAVFIVIAIRSLSSLHRMVRFHFSNLSFKWESVKKVLNIGIPAALTQVIFPLGVAALTFIISLGFHELGAVAFSLGFRVEFFAFLPAVGFGFAAMAMIGQNIGAGNLERAKEVFRKALKYGFLAAIMVEANAFQALGQSWPGFWILFLKFMVISIPLASIFTQVFHFSIIAIWFAIIAGNIVAAVVGYLWITRTLSKFELKEVPVHA